VTRKDRPVLVYFSGTGMTDRLINKINIGESFETKRIETGKEIIAKEYILITPTYYRGGIPKPVERFLTNNNPPISVIGTGNRQWGTDFCGAGKKIAEKYCIPLIAKVEQSGHYKEVNDLISYFSETYKIKAVL